MTAAPSTISSTTPSPILPNQPAVLLTHSLDEKPKLLVVANKSNLAQLVLSRLSTVKEIEVKQFDWDDQKLPLELAKNHWYKICLFLSHPLMLENIKTQLELVDKKFNQPEVVVVFPLTTSVGGSEIGLGVDGDWKKQVNQEIKLFNWLAKKIYLSGFVFYANLIDQAYYPTALLLSQIKEGVVVNPSCELDLLSPTDLAESLYLELVRPKKEPVLIQGESRASVVYITEIKSILEKVFQKNLVVKNLNLNIENNPIQSFLPATLRVIKHRRPIGELVHFFVEFVARHQSGDDFTAGSFGGDVVYPPNKKRLISVWNQDSGQANKQLMGDVLKGAGGAGGAGGVGGVGGVGVVGGIEEASVDTILNRGDLDPRSFFKNLFKEIRNRQKNLHLSNLTWQTKKGQHKISRHKNMFVGGLIVAGLAVSVLTATGMLVYKAQNIKKELFSFWNDRALPNTAQDKMLLDLEKNSLGLKKQLLYVDNIFSLPIFAKASQAVEIVGYVVELAKQQKLLEDSVSLGYQKTVDRSAESGLVDINQASTQADKIFKTLSLLQADLKGIDQAELSAEEKQLLAKYLQEIENQQKNLGRFVQLSPLFAQLLGDSQRRVYALVLQNDQELRPTGGFIQAVALLTFSQGKLVDYQVEDVYQIDQKVTGSVSPPLEISKFLGEQRWFFRDSNWSPDFPDAAKQMAWFLDKSLGVRVDGMVGINVRSLEEILAVLGQLDLPTYNEVLTKRNIAERMEFHSEVSLVNAQDNPDYSELVLNRILTELVGLERNKVSELFSSLVGLAEQKELLISMTNNSEQASFSALGWTGALIEPSCPIEFGEASCVVDVFMQVEANVGVNKANYYLDRQVDHTISLTDDLVSHKRVIDFKNKAQTNSWPKGVYKGYMRFYLPLEAMNVRVLVNSTQLDDEQLIIKHELGRRVVGMLVEVPVASQVKLELEYSIPHAWQTPFSYVFFDQKQPGARDVSPRVFIQHSPDLTPTLIAPQAEVSGDVIVFNPTTNSGHMFVGATFE